MLKNTVISILRSFSREEIIKFDDFLKSPYFNKKRPVQNLFAEIKKYYPGLDSSELEKDKVWKKLYPGKEYNYGVMKNLIHDLTKLAEQFITQEEYRQNEIQEFANLYKAIANRNLKNVLDNKEKNVEKISSDSNLNKITIPIEEYYHLITKILEAKLWNTHFHELKVSSALDRHLAEDNFIAGMLIHLIIINYTEYEFSLDVKNKTNNDNPSSIILNALSDNDFEYILESVKNRSETKHIILKCYILAYKAYRSTGRTEDVINLKDFFYANSTILPQLAIRDMDVMLLNTISLMKDFSADKDKMLLDVYKFKNANGLIVDKNKQLNSLQFIPWLVIFLEEQQPEELRRFIDTYSKYLIESDKADSLLVAESIYCILKEDFFSALRNLSKVKFDAFVLKNFVKKLTLLINYEMHDYESFLQSCDAHNHFMSYAEKENKIDRQDNIQRAKVLANSIHKLFQLKDDPARERLKSMELELGNLKMDFKKWFFRKIEELKNPLK